MVKYLRGDVGIGTLIVFIAMVLVAAIAATVLLNVSGMLQQRASSTGKQTTQQVSSNLVIQSIVGDTGSPTGGSDITKLTITLKAAAGSGKLDLKNLLVVVNNGSNETKFNASTSMTTTSFNFTERVDPNDLFDETNANKFVIDPSSLVDMNVNITNARLLPRKLLTVTLIPEVGTPVTVEITAPPTFNQKIVPLYP
ncbi:MAG: archaellin/type IV pilin N-terminal domain-containing protein [Candidatus Anstonellales archaeon]